MWFGIKTKKAKILTQKELKKYAKRLQNLNKLESKYEKLSDEELQSSFFDIKSSVLEKIKDGKDEQGALDEVLYDVFAIVREVSKRQIGLRHYDVQLIGGMVLHDGRIAEMKTGEGKTLVGTLAVALNALNGKGVHVVTVNDYLASRDAKELEPLYNFLGYSVGAITSDISSEEQRKKQYNADITYGTNNEFGFDYLRDNMLYSLEE